MNKVESFLHRHVPAPAYLSLPSIGISISDSAIKYVSLSRGLSHIELDDFGETKLPPGLVEDGVVKKPVEVGKLLAEIKSKTGASFATCSLPEQKTFTYETSLPSSAKGSIKQGIELHIEEHVPLPAAETIFDYQVTDEVGENVGLVVSAMSDIVINSYVEAFSSSGMVLVSLEPESVALARSLVADNDAEAQMIVDLGSSSTSVMVLSGGVTRLSASVALGGRDINQAIAKDLGVSIEEADKLKLSTGMRRQGAEAEATQLFYSVVRIATILKDELTKLHDYWLNERRGTRKADQVLQVLLVGGNANVPGLADYLTSGLPMPVRLANPWINMASFEDYIPKMHANDSLRYAVAIGLALRNMLND